MNEEIFCTKCGTKNKATNRFCVKCGEPLLDLSDTNEEARVETQGDSKAQAATHQTEANQADRAASTTEEATSIMDNVTSRLNSWTGGEGNVKISFSEFFGQVFQKHSTEEAEKLFIVGTKETTPKIAELTVSQVQPWFFARVLAFTFILGFLMELLAGLNSRVGVLALVNVIFAVAVPVSALILFFECNVYQNISFYQVVKMAFIGGVLSLILTMVLDELVGSNGQFNLLGAGQTGFAEELAKVLIAAYFISKFRARHILNGLLIGAAVGAGFAAFENVLYMFDDQTGALVPVSTAIIRTITSISTHTEWCAIASAGLVMVSAGRKVTSSDFLNGRFLKFLGLVMLIHACWDWEALNRFSYLKFIALAIITWIVVLVLIQAGLREVKTEQEQVAASKLSND